jgi:hypothetical protein
MTCKIYTNGHLLSLLSFYFISSLNPQPKVTYEDVQADPMAALSNMYRDSFGISLSSLSSSMGMKAAAGASTKKFTSDDLRVMTP